MQTSGASCREIVDPRFNVIARSEATKQSILSLLLMDCFASLAMTANEMSERDIGARRLRPDGAHAGYMILSRYTGMTGISRDCRVRIIDPETVFPVY
jgi:hypothetical protein